MPLNEQAEPTANPGELSMVRNLLGLTQQQMANELGISKRSVEEYESGRRLTPPFIRQALHYITLKVALRRDDPRMMTNETARLAEDATRMRFQAFLGDKTNGWAVFTGTADVYGLKSDYLWAVAANDAEEALKIIAYRQPQPAEGFRIVGRLSQHTIAQLGLKAGDACPL